MFFISGDLRYNHYGSDAITSEVFDGSLSVNRLMSLPNSDGTFSANAHMNKGFDSMSLSVSAGLTHGESLRQDVLMTYRSKWITAEAKLSAKLFNAVTAEYEAS